MANDGNFEDGDVAEFTSGDNADASAQGGTVADESGLVLGLNFEGTIYTSADGDTLSDVSGNSNNGTGVDGANNTGLTYAEGLSGTGNAIDFDGVDDYVNVDNPSNLNFTQPASVEFWIKTSSDTAQMIIAIGDISDLTLHQDICIGDGCTGTLSNELITLLRNSNGHRLGYTTATRTELIDGAWHHIAAIYSGTACSIYLDGVSKAITVGYGSNDGLWGNILGVDSANIGRYISGSGYLNGLIDSVRIYSRAFGADEIRAMYERGYSDHYGAKIRLSADDAQSYINSNASLSNGGNYLLSFDYRLAGCLISRSRNEIFKF